MPRFNLVLSIASSLVMFAGTASAQRAQMAVSAIVLPPAAEVASGSVAPRAATGNMVVASARLESTAAPAPALRGSSLRSGSRTSAGYAEFGVDLAVAANVHYDVKIVSGKDQGLQVRDGNGRFRDASSGAVRIGNAQNGSDATAPVSYRVPVASGGSVAPTPVVVVVTAASIS